MVGHHPTMFGDHIRIVVEVFSLSRDTIGNWNILVLLFNKMASVKHLRWSIFRK